MQMMWQGPQGHSISLTQRASQRKQQMALIHQHQKQLHQISVAPSQEPSTTKRELHNLTHIPFRSWCDVCVRAKARVTYHKGNLKSMSTVQMDYTFLNHLGDPGQRTNLPAILTMVESLGCQMRSLSSTRSHSICPGKVKELILENGFINSVIQVDGEPASKRIAETPSTSLN
eukprot:4271614-Amphidinium_carterae.4